MDRGRIFLTMGAESCQSLHPSALGERLLPGEVRSESLALRRPRIEPTTSLFSPIAVSAVHFDAADGSGCSLRPLPIRRWHRDHKSVLL
jgi:hypothetical protein